ncbi:hypothetical protein SAMN04488565_2210 [Leucobacter chromiiresistens]|uniref:Uncharacterized protein n=1 Tax=Leucobacter chromiiresistens TaxID=1079994 RepID=A0A1H0ZZR1_9MICO|nr:hypothetical protein SAMN04488565_2210 [Leucobacter chromiiresistens]
MQCTFCYFPNILGADEQDALCKNCGLDLTRLASTEHRAETADQDAAPEPVAPLNDAGTDVDPIKELLGDAAAERPAPAGTTEPAPAAAMSARLRDHDATAKPKESPKRRAAIHPWVIAGAFGVAILGATITTWVVLSAPANVATPAAAQQQEEIPINLAGWNATPNWSIDATAEATAERADGATLLIATTTQATIVDTETGDTIATHDLTGDATPLTYWADDTALVVDGDTLHLWGPTTETGDSDTAWATAELGDATLSVRGDAIFAVAEVGAKYDIMGADATRTAVAVPTPGAVPVAATGDTITWGTNKGVAYLTGCDGSDKRDVPLTAPSDTATVSRWISGDAKHVYVVWSDGDTDTVAVHALDTGDAVSSHPLAADRDAAATATRDGAHVAYAGLLIDATTGAFIETSRDIDDAVGGRFVTHDPLSLVNPAGGATPLEGDTVTLLAMSPDGDLVVDTGDTIASLSPDSKNAGVQTS